MQPKRSARAGEIVNKLLLVSLLVGLGVLGVLVYRVLRQPGFAVSAQVEQPAKPPTKTIPLFNRWPTDRQPDVVLVLTGQQYGYNKPCGCSEPQYGGLERRWNFIQRELKSRNWPVVALDLGDVAQSNSPQTRVKYVYSMRALKQLGYSAISFGVKEFAMPVTETIDRFFLNEPGIIPLVANLQDGKNPQGQFLGFIQPYYVNKETGVPIGVVGLVGPSVVKQVKDPIVKFDEIGRNGPAGPQLTDFLPGVVREMSQKAATPKDAPELLVLLYQGTLEEAKALATHYTKFSVILALSEEDEPREEPLKIGNTLIINVGHKGKKVGVLGIYRTPKAPKPFEFHYQLCSMSPKYQSTPDEQKKNPMIALLESYSREVKDQNFLAQHIRSKHPIQTDPAYAESTYVGSEKCKKCHEYAYKVWKESPHSQAYLTLEKPDLRPRLQQYDPECVRCHVTGLDHFTGFRDEVSTPHLKDNGCENCHGPASMHIKNKNDTRLHALMNPFKTQPNETPAQRTARINKLNDSCRKCHDDDNDVHWDIKKWDKIVHNEPKADAPAPAQAPADKK
jgi:hypothetical protein